SPRGLRHNARGTSLGCAPGRLTSRSAIAGRRFGWARAATAPSAGAVCGAPTAAAQGVASSAVQTLAQTPLHDRHVALGARMVPFAGWDMPVQYAGVLEEHRAVRSDCGVFDVSHMGELEVEGPHAQDLLQGLLSNDLDRVEVGGAQYTLLTNERGGIVDDLIVYRLEPCRYLVIVNAANAQTDFEWLKEREIRGSDVRDISDECA